MISFLLIAGLIHNSIQKPEIVFNKQSSALNINQDFLKILSSGQNRLLADYLWIVTLLESDHDHYKKKDLNSWMYLRFVMQIPRPPLAILAIILIVFNPDSSLWTYHTVYEKV